MSRIHVLESDRGVYRIVLHIPVPDETNLAGIALCDAIYHCRRMPSRERTWSTFSMEMAGIRKDIDAGEMLAQWGHSESGAPERRLGSPEETERLVNGRCVEVVVREAISDSPDIAAKQLNAIYARQAPLVLQALRRKFALYGLAEE